MKEKSKKFKQLMVYGESVFEDKSNFELWLKEKSIALGGISPDSLLNSEDGISLVKDALGRIEHGILA